MPIAALTEISTRHQTYFEGLKTHEANKTEKFLRRIDREIRLKLSGTELTELTRKRLETLLVSVKKDLKAITGQAVDEIKSSIDDIAQYEAGFEVRGLKQVVDYDFVTPSLVQLRAAVFSNPLSIPNPQGGGLLDSFLAQFQERTINNISGAIRSGYYQGETTNQILQRIRGTKARGFRDGIIGNTGREIRYVTRTALQHASQQARQAVWQDNKEIVKKVRWVSTLDSRTSSQCRTLDGQEYDIDKGPRPPIHINCRSTTIPVLDSRFKVLEEGRTRAVGGGGSISANKSYYDWLKTQSAEFQDSVIGVTRGKLLRNGGLTSQRFAELQLGKNFRPLTLEEMRELDPVAFGKAKI